MPGRKSYKSRGGGKATKGTGMSPPPKIGSGAKKKNPRSAVKGPGSRGGKSR